VRAQEGRQATRARGALRRGQCWIPWDVGRAACRRRVPRGWVRRSEGPRSRWGQARPAGWVFAGEAPRGAWQHSTVVRVGITRCRVHTREGDAKVACGRVDCRVHQSHESYYAPRPESCNNPATSNKKPRLLLPLVHNYPIKQHDSSAARCPASTVPGTARTQVSMSFVCGGSHAPLLDRNGRLVRESSRSRAAS